VVSFSKGVRAFHRGVGFAVVGSLLAVALPASAAPAVGASFPGFTVSEAFTGLTNPVATRFSSDGRVFVAEKSGLIKVFDSLTDTTASVVADFGNDVHNFWDRGLLGVALHPNFPATNWVYVLYAWDSGNSWGDACPNPPGSTNDGCVVNGRLARFQPGGTVDTETTAQILLGGFWCQQYPSHSLGDLEFGPGGALFVSAGDGASFGFTDYGNGGGGPGSPTPENPCGDPPVPVGGDQQPPSAEGGALRSQDLRTGGDPVSYDGAIIRVSDTGAPLPDNPVAGERIVAYGFRNPFRFTIRPGTSEVWVGDVGWAEWEEIDRLANPVGAPVENFGWPCFEGIGQQGAYDSLNLGLCEDLYTDGGVTAPYWSYPHVDGTPGCPGGGASITGITFYNGGRYPDSHDGALYFGDHTRKCVRVMLPGAGGLPDPASVATIISGIGVVDLERGPGGDLFITDFDTGAIYRLEYNSGPTAVATASPPSGTAPLTVAFSGAGSTDAEGDPLSYAWDLDNDGAFDDSNSSSPQKTYPAPGTYPVHLQVMDPLGALDTDTLIVTVTANQAPTASISAPSGSLAWTVGQQIAFTGQGTDPEDGTMAPAAHSWQVLLQHCVTLADCHSHPLQSFPGIKSGSFSAPNHEYPAYLTITLTVIDSGGLTDSASVDIVPQIADLTFATSPTGLNIVVGSQAAIAPFTVTAIVGGELSVNAPSPQACGVSTCTFSAWSDGGAASHFIAVLPSATTHTATYTPTGGGGGGGGGTSATPATFTDVPPQHLFFKEIEWLAASEITKGCSSTAFCPDEAVTRGQMAAFLTRALKLTAPSGANTFTDDEGSIFESDIEALYAAGITVGCSPTKFCPDDPVTRGQMAAFLTRALKLTAPPGADTFTDDEGSIFENQIEAIYVADITVGCGPGVFCPDQPVTRGQMAAFLYRALSGV